MRRWKSGDGFMGDQLWKIAEMQLPQDLPVAVGESGFVITKKIRDIRFVAREITKRAGVLEGKFERFERMVEADDPHGTNRVGSMTQHGQDIGGCAQAHVPNDELTLMRCHALRQAELFDVECFSFRHRPDDRMKSLPLGDRMNAVNAAGQLDEFVMFQRNGREVSWSRG